ncbi:MAG: hypothetical protein R8J94_06690 [Acidimicrobiia bacterium]|nr:hypothetical protein [Acidimicrobiia bacterium]
MSKFTERVEHDLSQIADRATPSSTAWESIQQRIAEQTTQPTVEVIMLNPDQKKPPTVSRTWMAVAAALILVVGIGALIAVLNQDDGGEIDTVDIPEETVPLSLEADEEPDVIVPDEPDEVAVIPDDESTNSAAVAEPEEPLEMTGFAVGDCNFGAEDTTPDDLNYTTTQSCKFRENNVVPFETIQQYVFTRYDDPEFHDGSTVPFTPITGLSDSGFMYAGYMWDGQPSAHARFVGVAEGVGPYEGELIYVSGRSFGDEGGVVHMQWAVGEELSSLRINGTDVEAVEVTPDCEFTGVVEDDDADPQTEHYTSQCTAPDGGVDSFDIFLFGPEANTLGIGSHRYVVATGSMVRSGLVPRSGGPTLSLAIMEGTGEDEGLLLHQLSTGTITVEGDISETVVQVALPPAE